MAITEGSPARSGFGDKIEDALIDGLGNAYSKRTLLGKAVFTFEFPSWVASTTFTFMTSLDTITNGFNAGISDLGTNRALIIGTWTVGSFAIDRLGRRFTHKPIPSESQPQ